MNQVTQPVRDKWDLGKVFRYDREPNLGYAAVEIKGGITALVSATDVALVKSRRWHLYSYTRADGSINRYANGTVGGRLTGMHRFILGLRHEDKIFVDHINGNSLDNRRENLRLASHKANLNNRRPDLRRKRSANGAEQPAGQVPAFSGAHELSDNELPDSSPVETWDNLNVPDRKRARKPRVYRARKNKSGRHNLQASQRETQIVSLLATGLDVTEIAEQLAISVKTVSTLKSRVCEKLGVRPKNNPIELIARARFAGVIPDIDCAAITLMVAR